jgi:hypothetical protein
MARHFLDKIVVRTNEYADHFESGSGRPLAIEIRQVTHAATGLELRDLLEWSERNEEYQERQDNFVKTKMNSDPTKKIGKFIRASNPDSSFEEKRSAYQSFSKPLNEYEDVPGGQTQLFWVNVYSKPEDIIGSLRPYLKSRDSKLRTPEIIFKSWAESRLFQYFDIQLFMLVSSEKLSHAKIADIMWPPFGNDDVDAVSKLRKTTIKHYREWFDEDARSYVG